jgi:hypothetical protein
MKTITILAIIAIFAGATALATTGSTLVTSALAQATDNATTVGNVTGGNITADTGNMTGSVSSRGKG